MDEFIPFKVELPKQAWVISNALIQRLGLQPHHNDSRYGMVLEGEDGEWYDIDLIMRRFLEVAAKIVEDK